jgi:hypothetical protein
MTRTPEQNKRFHALVQQLRLNPDVKADLVYQFSDGKVESSAAMNKYDMARLIKHLEGMVQASENKMRTKIVAIGREIGCVRYKAGSWDYAGLNAWLKKHYGKESLFRLSYEELVKAVTGMERWRDYEQRKSVTQLVATY